METTKLLLFTNSFKHQTAFESVMASEEANRIT